MENVMFESSVKLVWSPIFFNDDELKMMFESSVKLVWSPIRHML